MSFKYDRFCITPIFNGAAEKGKLLLEPMFALNPTNVTLRNVSFLDWEIENSGTTDVTGNAYITSGILPKVTSRTFQRY